MPTEAKTTAEAVDLDNSVQESKNLIVPAFFINNYSIMVGSDFFRLTFSEAAGDASYPRAAIAINRRHLVGLRDFITDVLKQTDDDSEGTAEGQ